MNRRDLVNCLDFSHDLVLDSRSSRYPQSRRTSLQTVTIKSWLSCGIAMKMMNCGAKFPWRRLEMTIGEVNSLLKN